MEEVMKKDVPRDKQEPLLADKHDPSGEQKVSRTPHQFRALYFKNVSLQWKQKGTNVCLVITPLICLIALTVINNELQSMLGGFTFIAPLPFIFNIPWWTINNSPFVYSTCLQWYKYDFTSDATQETRDFVGYNRGWPIDNPQAAGMFRYLQSQPCYWDPNVFRAMPFFEYPDTNINQDIENELVHLNTLPFDPFSDAPDLYLLPDGAVTFTEANDKKLRMKLQINDVRTFQYHRINQVTKSEIQIDDKGDTVTSGFLTTEGTMSILDLMTRAYLLNYDNSYLITSGAQYLPQKDPDKTLLNALISMFGACLYPIALCLMLPVFMYAIVLEKEERLQEMMKMNGMSMSYYWGVNYIFYLSIYSFTAAIFYLIGRYYSLLNVFTQTSPIFFIVVLFGWGLSQVSFAFFFQVFLAKSRTATIVGYLVSAWTVIIGISFNLAIYPYPYEMPSYFHLYPMFAFTRVIYLMCMRCSANSCIASFTDLPDELLTCLISLYVGAVVFLMLGVYLTEVLPQEYGVRKHPLFFLKSFFPSCFKARRDGSLSHSHDSELAGEDDDSKQEREFIKSLSDDFTDYPLVIDDLRKVYETDNPERPQKIAVKRFSLHVKHGEMFGLLGPNGAGKTSLIAMLTGLYEADAGNAWIAGFDIKNSIKEVHVNMGICPQFDLLWPELTVEDHLLFYSRLKGVNRNEEEKRVIQALKEVHLSGSRHAMTKELSGGMRRRLSVAISLVGNPKIVFLDEPTTGLDPENRRQLWDILVEGRSKRAMVLTTHSMEEADVLCTRIGIITKGVLRCVGPQVRLKSLYGGGYHLYINSHKEKYFKEHPNETKFNSVKEMQAGIIKFIEEILPEAKLVSDFNGNFIFLVPSKGLKVSKVFHHIEDEQKALGIADWGISQSSLEDVFHQVVKSNVEEVHVHRD